MAFQVRKLDQIIADEIDTSEYGSKQEILDAARKIQKVEKEWRDEELADEREIKRQWSNAKAMYRKAGRDPKSGMSSTDRKKLKRSGAFKECRGIFLGCGGTGWIGSLPHARCKGTGMVKISKSTRMAAFKKKRKRKRKSYWGSSKKRRRR